MLGEELGSNIHSHMVQISGNIDDWIYIEFGMVDDTGITLVVAVNVR